VCAWVFVRGAEKIVNPIMKKVYQAAGGAEGGAGGDEEGGDEDFGHDDL
jgi:hypothetical protein